MAPTNNCCTPSWGRPVPNVSTRKLALLETVTPDGNLDQKPHSESKFYFDKWQPTDSPLPSYIEEVSPLWTTPDTCPG